jgi:hypothetical protein
MIRYAKIIQTNGQRFIIRVDSESERFIRGIEVDKDGEEIQPKGFHNRLRIVEKTSISKMIEMRMNTIYATLEKI